MYNDDSYDYFSDEALLRRKFKRRLRLKRFLAAFIALLIIALIVGGLWLLISKLISNRKQISFTNAKYNYETGQLQLTVVNNVFTEEERRLYFPDEFTDEDEQISEDNGQTNIHEHDPYVENTGSGLIIVDAGHGGKDGGTTNEFSDEKDINLNIAYWVKEDLEFRGYTVYMIRTDDTYIDVNKRASIANSQENPLAMVSVHQNACIESDAVKGVEAWTYDRSGCRELAKLLADKVSEAVGAENRGDNYRTNLVVTSKTTMPSVIIECGYMSNPEEAAKLVEEDYQVKLARGIANALDEFINSYYK